jgi:hypothetical protein
MGIALNHAACQTIRVHILKCDAVVYYDIRKIQYKNNILLAFKIYSSWS